MPIQVQCPDCRAVSTVPVGHSDSSLRCEGCGARFLLTVDGGAGTGLPTAIDRYQVRALLGQGAFGAVYHAYDPRLGRDVAVKVLRSEKLTAPQAIRRFLREARASGKLHHPHIVPIHDAGHGGDVYFIVSEYIPGKTLAAAIPESGMPPHRAAAVTAQLASALGCAHRQGVLHRDVKPHNILLDEQGSVHLTDFGLAGWVEEQSTRLTRPGMVLGTPAYMAPEQVRGETERVGPWSDVYSAGVVFYQLLTGRLPFECDQIATLMYQIVNTAPPPPSHRRPGLDPVLEQICLKAMAKDPGRRYANGDEMAAALSGPEPSRVTLPISHEAAARPPTRTDRRTTLPPTLPPSIARPKKSRKGAGWKWALGVCTFLLVAAGAAGAAAVVYWWPPHPIPAPTDSPPSPVAATTAPPSDDGKKPGPVAVPNPKNDTPLPAQGDLVNAFGMKLKRIPAGRFLMGSAGASDPGDEKPQHAVDITRPFYLGVYPVTQGEYVKVTGEDNPSWFGPKGWGASVMSDTDTTKCPVEEVSWDGASAFCEMLNKKDTKKPAGWRYGLPTEAQWEYACRAGTKTAYFFGDDPKGLGDYAWDTDNSAWRTHPVGAKKANAWGLYDMSGHVYQWCADWYGADYYRTGPAADPTGPPTGDQRVLRGGSWNSGRASCRSAARYQFATTLGGVKLSNNDIGFRVCLVQEP